MLSETVALRNTLVLLHSAGAKCPPAIINNYSTMPEGSLGSQGEVIHCHSIGDTERLVDLPIMHTIYYGVGKRWRMI